MRALLSKATPRNGGILRLAAAPAPAAAACSGVGSGARPGTSSVVAGAPAGVAATATRWAGSSSSQWKQRQSNDHYAQAAKVQGLKSRAAFKLLEMDLKYKLFRKNQTVIDLGYAPGSWSQVALERTRPHGRVVGIDLLPAQAPKGVSTIQGNFLSQGVQNLVKEYLHEFTQRPADNGKGGREGGGGNELMTPKEFEAIIHAKSYIDLERAESYVPTPADEDGRLVDVVLSDMMMNTSGNNFRDHAGSMDLCAAALSFASDTLRDGGHFVAKFYQGAEDKSFEMKLKKMFAKVHREKPESSRSESKESYFVALRRKRDVTLADIEKK